eukprot:CAMPEP_0183727316 /NCGR_PEP_ID=MMETSP0737-20130205/25386_1 /TAXON_ID=385413 /ORGANISM="Thalassiosira miniscula, Strain CCMP1093" /LENGTH=444 /DNA_ID=CAMNT_0025958913 /DNA_START=110 /DNA_END=1444 /DNA_ORIENTATION=+
MADSDPKPAPSTTEDTADAADTPAESSAAQDPSPSDTVESATEAVSSLSVSADASSAPAAQPAAAAAAAPAPSLGQALPINLPPNIDPNDPEALADHALDNEFLSLLPKCIMPRIDRLKDLNDARDDILEEYRVERAALELKYFEKMKPLYEKRRGVVSGDFDGDIEKEAKEAMKKEEGEDKVAGEGVVEDVEDEEDENGEEDVVGIPQFWACAMGHVDVIAELITEADVDCLDHLQDVTCTDFPDGLGFELHFHFNTNPFFTNTVLTKRYEVPNLLTEDEPILKNVTGTTINWKPNQSLTYKQITKKQRKKGGPNAGQIRTITKKERTESFFHFFTPPKMPGLMEVMDEEEAEAVEEAFDHDYDVAQAFRGHLIPKAVLWFTGEAMMMDDEDLDEEEARLMMEAQGAAGGGEGGQQFAFNPSGNNPFPPPAAGNGENPECKQN